MWLNVLSVGCAKHNKIQPLKIERELTFLMSTVIRYSDIQISGFTLQKGEYSTSQLSFNH